MSAEALTCVQSAIVSSSDVYQPDHLGLRSTLMADPALSQEACSSLLQALGISTESSSVRSVAQTLQAQTLALLQPCADQQHCAQGSSHATQILEAAGEHWELDAFALEEATMGNSLNVLVGWLIAKEDLAGRLQLDSNKLQSFVTKVQQG